MFLNVEMYITKHITAYIYTLIGVLLYAVCSGIFFVNLAGYTLHEVNLCAYSFVWFLRASAAILKHVIDIGWTSVRPSVRPSHAGTVSKRLNILSCFLHHTIAHSF